MYMLVIQPNVGIQLWYVHVQEYIKRLRKNNFYLLSFTNYVNYRKQFRTSKSNILRIIYTNVTKNSKNRLSCFIRKQSRQSFSRPLFGKFKSPYLRLIASNMPVFLATTFITRLRSVSVIVLMRLITKLSSFLCVARPVVDYCHCYFRSFSL